MLVDIQYYLVRYIRSQRGNVLYFANNPAGVGGILNISTVLPHEQINSHKNQPTQQSWTRLCFTSGTIQRKDLPYIILGDVCHPPRLWWLGASEADFGFDVYLYHV